MKVRPGSSTISGPQADLSINEKAKSPGPFATLHERELTSGIVFAILIAVIGIILTMQGWRSRTPAHDLVPHIHNVQNLVRDGEIPVHGDTGSYGSYKPPGTAWVMLPSALLFDDLRLIEYGGSALLHLATLLGIYLLAYRYFGWWSACLAVLIYGLSNTGIFLAGSLWPNGRPDFFIWTIYFASQWVMYREGKYLAIAIAIWGIGMNVDMAILPVALVFPALWLVYRPPIHPKPLFMAMGIILLAWFPYLRFEFQRSFVDIRSQIFFRNIFPAEYQKTWCDPTLQLLELGGTSAVAPLNSGVVQPYAGPNLVGAALVLTDDVAGKLIYNFQDAASIPAMKVVFLLVVLSSLTLFHVGGYTSGSNPVLSQNSFWQDWVIRLALTMVVLGILTNEFVIAGLLGVRDGLDISIIRSLRTVEKLLILGGSCILAVKGIATLMDRLLYRAKISIQDQEQAHRIKVLILSLTIPWFILLLVAEPGKPERFWWLWPLQSIFLAAFITWLLPRFRVPPLLVSIMSIGVVIAIAWNSTILARIDDWRHNNGWGGKDAPEILVIDHISGELKARGKEQAAIGYHFFIYQFMAAYNITNPQYKVGNDFDLLLQYPHGITNTNQCAEGLSPEDEYRIVQTRPRAEDWAPRMYFDAPLGSEFTLVDEFGPYQVFKRQLVPAVSKGDQ